MTYLVDSHCHLTGLSLNSKAADSIEQIIKRANLCNVSHFLNVSCTNAEFKKGIELLGSYDNIYHAVGIHPLNLDEEPNFSEEELEKNLLSSDKVIALGETGLDYFYSEETKDAQIESFAKQLQVALKVKKPLVIHARCAHKDTVALLKSENARDVGGVIHCFTDSVQMARECLDLGFYISFTGISTFKASDNVREVIKYVPLDRMLVETDCPYLAPIPVRGIENEPAFVRYTLDFIAKFKNVSEDYLASVTSENFENLYNLKLKDITVSDVEVSDYKLDTILRKPFSK